MIEDHNIDAIAKRARTFAALSGEFDPVAAIRQSFGSDEYEAPIAARVMGMLRADCTVAASGKSWIMRQSPRDRLLASIGPEDVAETSDWGLPGDELATTMRTALGQAPGQLTEEIEGIMSDSSPDLDRVDTLARAIELAGSAGGAAFEMLPALQSTLNRHTTIRRAERQLAQGYFGNEALRERLGSWIDNPYEHTFARALYIRGIPGVGKSFLLTKLVQEARERSNPIVLWLDFDRRGLNLVEPDGLTMELARQLGNELPESSVQLANRRAQDSGRTSEYSSKRGQRSMSTALVSEMGKAVQASGRDVLLVLDTLEVLASQGPSHPGRLFDFLDDLLNFGVAPISIVAAGRGTALEHLGEKRVEDVLLLTGLPNRVAMDMLAKLETPAEAVDHIIEIAHGNPLILRLAAKLAREGGKEAVEIERVDGAPPEVAGGYLYRAILSRIEGDNLCAIANLGLVMHRIDAGAIAEVIAPALGMELSADAANELFERLSTHHWLVDEEPDGWVRHRSDVRSVVLRLLYADKSDEVMRVNLAAASYLSEREPWSALYHRLQALGPESEIPAIDPALAAKFTNEMLEELPNRTADAVLQARGERSRSGRGRSPAREDEQEQLVEQQQVSRPQPRKSSGTRKGRAARKAKSEGADQSGLIDLHILLEKGDLIEAQLLFDDLFVSIPGVDRSGGIAAMCHFWLSGQWSKALKLYRQYEHNDFRHAEWKGGEALVKLVTLEMRAEFGFDALVAEFEHNEAALREAQLTYRDAKALRLTEGALAYALLAENRPNTISGGWRDALVTAGTGMEDTARQEHALRDAHSQRARHGIPEDFGGNPPWEIAACLNPYAAPIATLSSMRSNPTLTNYIVSLSGGFRKVAHMPFDVDEGTSVGSRLLSRHEVMVEQLGALGATADWLSAFAFFNPIPNVPLIARRAEMWRRSAAGQWVYGSNAPVGWVEPEHGLDRGAMAWLDRLRDEPDPVNEAARQLLFWHDPSPGKDETGATINKRSVSRIERALKHARRAAGRASSDPVVASARALMDRKIGRTVAIPLSVIAVEYKRSGVGGEWLNKLVEAGGKSIERVLAGED